MKELKAAMLRRHFAGNRALVSLILIAVISFLVTVSTVGVQTKKPM